MNDEEVATYAIKINLYSDLLSKYLDNYENDLLLAGSTQAAILRETKVILHELEKVLPPNKLDELLKPIVTDMNESHYYRERK